MNYPSESAAVDAFNANRCTFWLPVREGGGRCTRQADHADKIGDRCAWHARPGLNPDLPPLALIAERLAFKLHGIREDDGRPVDYLYPDDARTIIDGVRELNDKLARMMVAELERAGLVDATPSEEAPHA